jgi:LCP family protein required for cell wall assembly
MPTITPVPLAEVAPGAPPVRAAHYSDVPPAPRDSPAPPAGAAITVLLLGVDQRPDESGPSRSDAIMIARLDPARGRIALLSLPRDLIVDIPGYGSARINAASAYGDLYPELGGGTLMRRTVSKLLGTPIDYVVRVDFDGFVGAIDAIGGINVDVPEELYDPEYPTMDYGYRVAHFTPGPQHMDGATALVYSRIRHMDSTYARNRRQQAVLLAVLARLREQNALQQLQSVASITTALRDYIQTDMPMDRIVDLAWALHGIAPGSVERYALDESMVAEQVLPDDPYATFALPGAIESLVRKLLGTAAR